MSVLAEVMGLNPVQASISFSKCNCTVMVCHLLICSKYPQFKCMNFIYQYMHLKYL